MSTKRQRLIAAVKDLLVAGGTTAAVYKYRATYAPGTSDILVIMVGDGLVTQVQGEEELIDLDLVVRPHVAASLDDAGDLIESYYGYVKQTLLEGNVNKYRMLGSDRAKILHRGDESIAQLDNEDFIVGGVGLTLQYVEHIGRPDSN